MRISVITINRNTGDTVRPTIASLRAQTHLEVEWVVIDGASTDVSLELLRGAVRPGDVFLSEPDRGISDAFNKGIARATGEAILFMNSGDEFAGPDSLADLARAWDRGRHRWIVGAGDILAVDGTLLFRRSWPGPPRDPFSLVRTNCRIIHQTVLADRGLFAELGPYREDFKVAMDYELWIRWLKAGHIPQVCQVPVCRFHRGGASGDPLRNHREFRKARALHGMLNGVFGEGMLQALAWTKGRIRGRYGRWLYRLKERLGVRI